MRKILLSIALVLLSGAAMAQWTVVTVNGVNNIPSEKVDLSAGSNAVSYSFRFGEGTTGIENVTTENVNVTVIYDLTGRRVEAITAPGIYIVNGVKRVIR